jgi:hypothetical protein
LPKKFKKAFCEKKALFYTCLVLFTGKIKPDIKPSGNPNKTSQQFTSKPVPDSQKPFHEKPFKIFTVTFNLCKKNLILTYSRFSTFFVLFSFEINYCIDDIKILFLSRFCLVKIVFNTTLRMNEMFDVLIVFSIIISTVTSVQGDDDDDGDDVVKRNNKERKENRKP